MNSTQNTNKLYSIKTLVFIALFLFFSSTVLYYVFPDHSIFYSAHILNYIYAAVVSYILLYKINIIIHSKEMIIIILFLLWTAFIGLYNSYLNVPAALNITMVTLVAFIVPFLLEPKGRSLMTVSLLVPTILLFTVFSLFGIYAFLISSNLEPITRYIDPIVLTGDYFKLSVFGNAESTAVIYSTLFIISLFLVVYFKNIFLRILIGLVLFIFFIVIALSQNIVATITFAVLMGLISAFFYYRKKYSATNKNKLSIFFVLTIVIAAFTAIALVGILNIFNVIRISLSSYDLSHLPYVAQQTDISTPASASGNLYIWSNSLKIFIADPKSLLLGYSLNLDQIIQEINNISGQLYSDLNSGYLFILLTLGVVGLLLALIFITCVLFRIFDGITNKSGIDNNLIIYSATAVYILITELTYTSFSRLGESFLPVLFIYCCGMICSLSTNDTLFDRIKGMPLFNKILGKFKLQL